jgi:hypothetical protein
VYLGLETELLQVVKLIRNIAFVLVITQDTVGAELDDLLGRKVKAIIDKQTRNSKNEGSVSDHNGTSRPVQSSEHHTERCKYRR